MNKGLDELAKYNVIKPLFKKHEYTKDDIPIIRKEYYEIDDLQDLEIINLKNYKSVNRRLFSIVIMFNTDAVLNRMWNDPYRYLPKLTGFYAVCTPDFSIYDGMNKIEKKFNVYRNRWIGCMMQDFGYRVIPTIQWGDEETFDYCFSGVEEGSVVIISTLGCHSHQEAFLKGFNEMKRIIKPEIIIVFGKMIKGMTGTFINFEYEESFAPKDPSFKQMSLFPTERIFTLE